MYRDEVRTTHYLTNCSAQSVLVICHRATSCPVCMTLNSHNCSVFSAPISRRVPKLRSNLLQSQEKRADAGCALPAHGLTTAACHKVLHPSKYVYNALDMYTVVNVRADGNEVTQNNEAFTWDLKKGWFEMKEWKIKTYTELCCNMTYTIQYSAQNISSRPINEQHLVSFYIVYVSSLSLQC